MTNNELEKILIWAQNNSQKGFTWNDLVKKFNFDEAKLSFIKQRLRSGMNKNNWLVDDLISIGNETRLSITQKGCETLNNLQSQKSPLYNILHNPWVVGIGLFILGPALNKALSYFGLMKISYWAVFGVIAIVLLLFYWRTRNAVWGGLTIGLIVGIAISFVSIFQGVNFDWHILGKSAVIGTVSGFVAELLGKLSGFLKRK